MLHSITHSRIFWRDAYIGLVCALAGVLAAAAFVRTGQDAWNPLGALILVLMSAIAERHSVPLPRDSQVSVATMPHMVAILLLPTWVAVCVGALGMLIDQLLARSTPRKVAFNTASVALTIGAAATVGDFVGLDGTNLGAPDRWLQVPGFLVVSAVYYLVTNLLVSIVVAIANGNSVMRTLTANARFSIAAEFSVCVIGGLIAVTWTLSPAWVPMIIFPGVVSQIAITHMAANRRQSDELRHQALHDALTGLPNRNYLATRLQAALDCGPSQTRERFSLLMMDLDRFKEVNDTFGHTSGDQLLREVGSRLRSVLDDADVLARLGGDEFAVLLPNTDAAAAERVARELLRMLEEPIDTDGQRLHVGASIGIASCPAHGTDALELMRRADVAMYAAKREHRGVAVYAPGLDDNSPLRLALFGELRSAVERGELRLHFQPKVSAVDGRVTGVEALVRWEHPERGLLAPDEFIPFAERTGLIQPIGRWVLEAALRQCRRWADQGIDLSVAVNLTVMDLQEPSLPRQVAAVLAHYDLDGSRLCVEITESTLMGDAERARRVLDELRRSGVRVAIDDFGTGYSSLAYLKHLPVDELKIDRSFVNQLATDRGDLAIVQSVTALAHALGLRVTAEGVEDATSLARLQQLGCDELQGYYVCRPMEAHALLAWLTEQSAAPQLRAA